MASDALDGIDIHTKVCQASDARTAGSMDGDMLRATDLRDTDEFMQQSVVR